MARRNSRGTEQPSELSGSKCGFMAVRWSARHHHRALSVFSGTPPTDEILAIHERLRMLAIIRAMGVCASVLLVPLFLGFRHHGYRLDPIPAFPRHRRR